MKKFGAFIVFLLAFTAVVAQVVLITIDQIWDATRNHMEEAYQDSLSGGPNDRFENGAWIFARNNPDGSQTVLISPWERGPTCTPQAGTVAQVCHANPDFSAIRSQPDGVFTDADGNPLVAYFHTHPPYDFYPPESNVDPNYPAPPSEGDLIFGQTYGIPGLLRTPQGSGTFGCYSSNFASNCPFDYSTYPESWNRLDCDEPSQACPSDNGSGGDDPGGDSGAGPGTTPPDNPDHNPDPDSPPPNGGEDGSASTFGDPHMTTFDDLFLSIQSVGEFILSRSTVDDFEVQARFTEVSDNLSANAALAMNVAGDRVGLYTQEGNPPSVFVNGEEINYGDQLFLALDLPSGGTLSIDGAEAMVVWPDGSVLTTELMERKGRSTAEIVGSVKLTLPAERAGKLEGILGDFNGDWADDIRTRSGSVLTDPTLAEVHTVFAESWRITQSESLFDYPTGKSTVDYTDRSAPRAYVNVESLDPAARASAEQTCRDAGVIDPRVLRGCILDVAATGDPAWAAIAVGLDPNTLDITIVPLSFVMLMNDSRELGVVVSGPVADRQAVTWTAEAGQISGSGNVITYTSPSEPGEYTLTASLDEDPSVTATAKMIVLETLLTENNVRFSLSWEDTSDLDSHLWLPQEYACHVDYGNVGLDNDFPYATLDRDDTDGFGPETITIHQRYNVGVYEYAVNIYSGTDDFSTPGIRVEMYTSQGRVRTFTPPAEGIGTWWHVFSIDGATGELTEVNKILGQFEPYADTCSGSGDATGSFSSSSMRQLQPLDAAIPPKKKP